MAADPTDPHPGKREAGRWKAPDAPAIIIIVAGVILALALNAAYTTWAVNQSQHRWCATIGLLNRAEHGTQAPTSSYGKQLAADFGKLFPALGCGP